MHGHALWLPFCSFLPWWPSELRYDMAWGQYQLEDPDWYGRQVARRGDYRTLQVGVWVCM